MAARQLYDGSLAVDADDYLDDTELEVPGLDDIVTPLSLLQFQLDYPFEKPFNGEVRSDTGTTLRQIIDAIRAGYRAVYSGSTSQDHPNLDNKIVDGDYGRGFHEIGDLVIEGIAIDDDTGVLDVSIGS
jgi:hypothetical protein